MCGRRDQLVIQDDPAFELDFKLPAFSLDDDGNVLIAQTNNTQKSSSQMSPLTGNGSSRSQRSPLGAFNISASPGGSGLHQLEIPFGLDSVSSQKFRDGGLGNLGGDEEDQLVMDDDWGIRIDDEGNVVLADEPQLPQLPHLHSDPAAPNTQQNAPAPAAPEPDEMMIDAGDILPEADAFPQRRSAHAVIQETSSSAAAPVRRQRRKVLIRPDAETMLTTAQIRAWSKDYADRSDTARKETRATTQAQARKHAYNLTFGFGIAHVGAPTGIPGLAHPLAQFFAGPALERSILGLTLKSPAGEEPPHGHRRTSGETFGTDPDDSSRRVRPRLTDTPQAGRGEEQEHDAQIPPRDVVVDDDMAVFDDDGDLELGREAPGSSARRFSNVSAPWNRDGGSTHGSSARGSAVKASGPGLRQVSASPLHGRGGGGPAGLPAIERLSSDHLPLPFESDGLLGPAQHDYPSSLGRVGEDDEQQSGETRMQQQAALDQEGLRFLDFIRTAGRAKGGAGADDGYDGRSWVEFDSLFEPQDATKAVVTQAFFHVLALATRDVIKVAQDDPIEVPFGPIRLGVLAGGEGEEGEEEAEDVLAEGGVVVE